MCGRFTRNYTWAQIHAMYSLIPSRPISNLQPRFNICPTTQVDAVVSGEQGRELVPMRWGLIPSWWSKPLKEMKLATFNARSDRIVTAPFFRGAFKRTRCIMPASGYYEWHTIGKEKQPYYFTRADGDVMTIAALWDEWNDKATGETLKSCAMVITEPNKLVAEVHDRMPVILEPKDFEAWEKADPKEAAELMKPADEAVLQKWPVSKRVNSSRTDGDDATLIDRISL